MDQRTYTINVNGYKGIVDRIDKRAARSVFDSGEVVFLLAVNLYPGMMWQPCPVKQDEDQEYETEYSARIGISEFDRQVNSYTYYNCMHETGYYPAFYQLRG